MNTHRRTAIIVGVLILLGYPTSILGGSMIEGILTAPDYLANLAASQTLVALGVLLELVNGVAVIGIAVGMFPLLKKENEALALGYVAARTMEAVVVLGAVLSALTLVALGQAYVGAGAPDASLFQAAGASWVAARGLFASEMLGIVFGLGALVFYTLLYRSKLVPRFISVWGLIAAALVLALNLLGIFGLDLGLAASMVFALPIMLNEILLAIWLIVKGFDPSAIASPSAD
jgi:hypothetical protein